MKKRGIIERIVMGKPREKDFTEADLPKNRKQQFAFVFRARFRLIFYANLLAALFWVPYAVWYFMATAYVTNAVSDMTQAEYISHLFYFGLLRDGVLTLCSALGFVGLAGIYYVVRRICWGQPVKITSDFFRGIKTSWNHFLGLGIFAGLVNFVVRYVFSFSLVAEVGSEILRWIAIATAVVVAVVCLPITMFACCHATLYNTSFAGLLKNSVILTFKKLWSAIGISVLSLLPIFLFAFMPFLVAKLIGACLAGVFSIGFAVTLQTVYCHGVFDKYINAENYPKFVKMGLMGAADYGTLLRHNATAAPNDLQSCNNVNTSEENKQPDLPDSDDDLNNSARETTPDLTENPEDKES